MTDTCKDDCVHVVPGKKPEEMRETAHRASETVLKRITFAGELALCGCALLALGAYLYAAGFRVRYPFDIDWCEGAIVDIACRVNNGLPLYVQPTPEYAPYPYGPVYYYLCAFSFRLLGVGIPAARAVTCIFYLATLYVINRFIHRETGQAMWGLIGVGMFCALYNVLSGWSELVRVDFPFVFFFIAGAYVARFGQRSFWGGLSVGALLFLSVMTKQTALLMSVPVLLCMTFANWRRGLWASATLVLLFGGSVIWLNRVSDGWYAYYALGLLAKHSIVRPMLAAFWRDDLLGALPIATAFAAILILGVVVRRPPQWYFYLLVPGTMLASSWASRLQAGSSINSTLPAYVILVILCASAVPRMTTWLCRYRAAVAVPLHLLLYTLVALQFVWLAYDPRRFIPPDRDIESGRRLVEMMRAVEGNIFIPHHGFLTTLAGKPPCAHHCGITDVLGSNDEPRKKRFLEDLRDAFRTGSYAVVILDNKKVYPRQMGDHYIEVPGTVFQKPSTMTLPGLWATRPTYVYVHKNCIKNIVLIKQCLPIP